MRSKLIVSTCILALTALGSAACGGADETDTSQSSDAFRGQHFRHRSRSCTRAFNECLANECGAEIHALRGVRPFSHTWFRQFESAKACALHECSNACEHHDGGTGTGGAAGTGGAGGSAGSGSSGGSGSGSICRLSPNACQACLCQSCQAQVTTCSADSACVSVMNCGFAQHCSGVDCYFKADGSRGPCADVIDAAGGPAGASVGKALDVFRCSEPVRPSCTACTQ
jgi:hypothetical protein